MKALPSSEKTQSMYHLDSRKLDPFFSESPTAIISQRESPSDLAQYEQGAE